MLQLQGVYNDYIWGGTKFSKLFGWNNSGKKISEGWVVSVHPDGPSFYKGGTLAEFLKTNPQAVDRDGSSFPVLIKYIDAAHNLSVQVHPNDEYAHRVENDNGKTEMWYVFGAEKGAGIYCGFKRDTDKKEFLSKVKDGTVEELLNFIPVKEGDCFLIEAGTVHAIGAGCVICEVQQSSNVTYRVYDYNRKGADGKPRPLHVEKAVDVINFKAFKDQTNAGFFYPVQGGKMRRLTRCKYFECRKLDLDGTYTEEENNSFTAINVLKGEGKADGKPFKAGDSFFVSCGEKFTLAGKAEIILTTEDVKKYYIGIDLGGTFVKCGIVDAQGNILIKDKIPTGNGRPYTQIATGMAEFAEQLIARAGLKKEDVKAAGIGAPGTVDSQNGVIVYSNNIRWENVPLCGEIEKRLKLPTYITNDANAAALGENFCGAGKEYQSMVFITLGTGVGGGIIIDGKLFEGNKSAGAEIGHEMIRMGGEKCTCGRKGCFEAYASATALINQTKRAMQKNADSLLWNLCENHLDNVEGKTVFDAKDAGDKTAEKVVKNYIRYLAEGVTNLVNVFRPEAIVLGGGVCAQGDKLIKPLKRKVNAHAYGGVKYAPVEIVTASLGNDAGLCGAARLAITKVN